MSKKEHQILDFYDKTSKTYDRSRFQSTEGGRQTNLIQQAIVKELCGNVQSKEVLELAVGTGRFTKTMVDRKANIIGVDASISMLKITRQKVSEAGFTKKASLIRADITKLPFRDKNFDYVICINALNHIPRYINAVEESARVLKSHGFLIANFPCMTSIFLPIALLVNATTKSLVRPVFSKWFTLKQILLGLSEHGLDVKEIQGHVPVNFVRFVKVEKLVRKSFLRYFSGVLFIKAKKC